MKILVYEKYNTSDTRTLEYYKIYYGKDEGEYYLNDHITGKKGIRSKIKKVENGIQFYYGDWCCTGALTKHDAIMQELGGNGYVEGYIPNITIKDLETGHIFNAAGYMKANNLTKFDGGWDNAEKYFEYMYKNKSKKVV